MQLSSDLYNGSFASQLVRYVSPRCVNASEVYDASTKTCLPASDVRIGGDTQCGADPYHVQVAGKCRSTNSCFVTPEPGSTCVDTQPIVVGSNYLKGADGRYRTFGF